MSSSSLPGFGGEAFVFEDDLLEPGISLLDKKKQTRPPHKGSPVPPRPTPLEWPDFYAQPLSAAVRANPVACEDAHEIIASANKIAGLLSVTKTSGPVVQRGEGKGDWKAGVRGTLINAWILHRRDLALFTHGGKNYSAQNEWHNSRSRKERDEFRI
ncbi:hypothetical protein N431DRAFT_465671 [Stipitochalara longipes BDJ]|nr:hypothetical protein N431DRAFT_465671 [Stipitochalara longipes BDJ]